MEVLRFDELVEGVFVRRRNRFLSDVLVNGRMVPVHLMETGRAGELLVPGRRVLLLPKETKKTLYSLVAVERKPYGWVFLNPGYHSRVARVLIKNGLLPEVRDATGFAQEVKIGKSRIDFVLTYHNDIVPLEVKGCTLFQGDVALFPDAPTERGRRHVEEISRFPSSQLWFLTMSNKVRVLSFHHQNDPLFTHALISSLSSVHVVAPTFRFDGRRMLFSGRVPFLFPITNDARLVMNVLKEAEQSYNEDFSPEATSFVNGLIYGEEKRFWVVFWGHLCVSCSLFDYFEDFSLKLSDLGLKSRPTSYRSFGNTYVVEYRIT